MSISALLTKYFAGLTLRVATKRQADQGALTGFVEEAYSGRAVIKAFGRDEASEEQMAKLSRELSDSSCIADFLTNAVGPAIRFIGRIAQVVIGLIAGGMLMTGQLTVGVFQAFFQYMNKASEPLTQLSLTVNMLQGALAGAERVFVLLDEEEIEPDPAQPAKLPESVEGLIKFEHVRFGYDPDRILMHDVSLEAKPGQR